MDCAVHPGVDAPYECSRCHEFICADCQVKVEGNIFCRSCFAALHKQFADRYRRESRNINYAAGIATGALAGVLVGYVWAQLAAWTGYLLPFGVATVGGAVGAGVVRGAGGKRSEKLQEYAGLLTVAAAFAEWFLADLLTQAPLRYGVAGYDSPISAALHFLPTYLSQEVHVVDWIFLAIGVVWSWWLPHVRAVPE